MRSHRSVTIGLISLLTLGVAGSARAESKSTVFNGVRLDEARYEADIQRLLAAAKAPPKPGAAALVPVKVVDAQSALADIKQSFGFVPEFFYKTSMAALPGAWIELRDVELNPHTSLPSKYKSLVGLAVASQIPCRYCVTGDTSISKFAGATDGEISEAVAMGRSHAAVAIPRVTNAAGFGGPWM